MDQGPTHRPYSPSSMPGDHTLEGWDHADLEELVIADSGWRRAGGAATAPM